MKKHTRTQSIIQNPIPQTPVRQTDENEYPISSPYSAIKQEEIRSALKKIPGSKEKSSSMPHIDNSSTEANVEGVNTQGFVKVYRLTGDNKGTGDNEREITLSKDEQNSNPPSNSGETPILGSDQNFDNLSNSQELIFQFDD